MRVRDKISMQIVLTTISTTLLYNLYVFVWQSPSFYFMITGQLGKSWGKLGTQLGKRGVFDYPMWADAMHLSGGRTAM